MSIHKKYLHISTNCTLVHNNNTFFFIIIHANSSDWKDFEKKFAGANFKTTFCHWRLLILLVNFQIHVVKYQKTCLDVQLTCSNGNRFVLLAIISFRNSRHQKCFPQQKCIVCYRKCKMHCNQIRNQLPDYNSDFHFITHLRPVFAIITRLQLFAYLVRSKESVQKDKQRSTKHTHKTEDRVTRILTNGRHSPLFPSGGVTVPTVVTKTFVFR